MIKWDHWHVELSSICTLKCPRCPRAEVPESLLNRQLSLAFFKHQLGADVVQQIRKITFCGNDGDPIYCREFLEICEWLKQTSPSIELVIITNGSYKTPQWWQSLAGILTNRDEIHWSLDGWDQASNEKYRVNSNWQSIQQGIQEFFTHNSATYRVCDSIAFNFNQHQLEHMKTLAKEQNFDCFQLTKSTKFGSKYPSAYGTRDLLEPSDSALVASAHRYERVVTALTSKVRPGQELRIEFQKRATQLGNYSGICMIGNKGVFLNSRGEFYPCCWTANRYEHNSNWHQLAESQFNLNHRTFNEILQDPFWSTDFLRFDSLECQTKCTPARLSDADHTTEW